MKVLMLCGVFAKENEQEVMAHARGFVDFSANLFQHKLINGFRELGQDLQVLSAPFIGSYPNTSDIVRFRGFAKPQTLCQYVPFCNIWGLRNPSRSAALKKALKHFVEEDCGEKLIVVYCPHTPFLEAAVWAKKRDRRIKICLYVPDLPNYMNLSAKRSLLYDLAKRYDIAVMTGLMEQVDSFVLLTQQMQEALPVGNKPCRVVEGIITKEDLAQGRAAAAAGRRDGPLKYVVYTGKLNERFGVKNLVDAFLQIPDPNYRLVLCGRGDCEAYVGQMQQRDSRLCYLGQVPAAEAKAWVAKASVLVNPRQNNEVYTKYSFPSKNIEYLLSGNPVVAYKLDGMPDVYSQFINLVKDDTLEALRDAIVESASAAAPTGDVLAYLAEKCEATKICSDIINMTGTGL